MKHDLVPVRNTGAVTIRRPLTPAQFGDLAELPPEFEWLANLTNPKTRRAYKIDVEEFIAFAGLGGLAELRLITRAHVIAWRKDLEKRELAHSSIRRKLSALSALFDYLCEHNAVAGNPVDGVKRPMANGNEGSTPALGDAQARRLLEAPPADTLKGMRDRAILATLLYHGLRREELCGLRVKDIQSRQGVIHFRIRGKRDKIRFVPVHVTAQQLIAEYLALAGHAEDAAGPLFRPVKNNVTGELDRPLNPNSVYRNIVQKYGLATGVRAQVNGLCVHSLRATAATNALSHEADIAKVQEWLGHANVSTTRLHDRRKTRPEDSPTFRVRY
jgi:integrase/recombinase XerD